MNSPAELAAAASGRDPMIALRALSALRQDLVQLESRQVRAARGEGWSWQQIAEVLGVSKQAAHKKHAPKRPASTRRARPGAATGARATASRAKSTAPAAGKPRNRARRSNV